LETFKGLNFQGLETSEFFKKPKIDCNIDKF